MTTAPTAPTAPTAAAAVAAHPVRTVRTMCPMNCHPTLCGQQVDLAGDRVVAVRGDPAHPDSRGFLCVRGQATREIPDHPDRLRQPLLRDRRGGPLRPASWGEALDRVAQGIAASPPAATSQWPGHGSFATNYGTRIHAQLMARFANLHGSRFWNPTMVCWGLGAFGLALTGLVETHTMDDLADHAQGVLAWGANLASQPNTGPRLAAARARGAWLAVVDVRVTELAAKADELLLVRPGTDTALALAMAHVIVAEELHDTAFVDAHTVGFDDFAAELRRWTPGWAEPVCGVPAERIVALARRYAATRPAQVLLGGSSPFKGDNGWMAARAVACLPALCGQVGLPGAGFGPRHGAGAHGRGFADVTAADRRRAPAAPGQMADFAAALDAGEVDTLLVWGSHLLSSFPDTRALRRGLARTRQVVVHELFANDTVREVADVVLPATCWLEELGAKATQTHLSLVEPVRAAPAQCRPLPWVLRALADRLDLPDFHPWADDEALVDAVLDHPGTGHATVAALRRAGGTLPLAVGPVAHADRRFPTPSGRIEFHSSRARDLGLPALPTWLPASAATTVAGADPARVPDDAPLVLTHGRTLTHFHAFYDHGRALPLLAAREQDTRLWISPADAAARGVADGATVRVHNRRGALTVRARVTDRIPDGTVWLRDGWPGLNTLTDATAVLPDAAVDAFAFAAGQSRFAARVEVSPATD